MTDAREIARFLQAYAKHYHGGAFATPTAVELATLEPNQIRDVHADNERTVIVSKTLSRDSIRRDFVGNKITLPAGARIASTVARTAYAPVPSFADYDIVTTYIEDRPLTDALRQQGRTVLAYQISAASEITALWTNDGAAVRYDHEDLVTTGTVSIPIHPALQEAMIREIQPLAGWDDDYPFYSDGSWSALSLRGFYPDDPTRGVKPAEMPKTWKSEHPSDLARSCDWTVLAEDCPSIVSFIESVPEFRNLERVRLLRMGGQGGKGGALRRHTDITDRSAGTKPGQIARFHIALQTDPAIRMSTWNLNGDRKDIHLAPFVTWYLDQRKPHAVTNPTGVDRIHLVIDVVVDQSVRQLLRRMPPE